MWDLKYLSLYIYIEGLNPRLRDTLIIQNPFTILEASQAARALEFQVQRLKGDRSSTFNLMQAQRNETTRASYRNPQNNNQNFSNNNSGPSRANNNPVQNQNNLYRPPFRNQDNLYRPPFRSNPKPTNAPNNNANNNLPTRPPLKEMNSAIEQLTQQMGEMQIKMSQMDPPHEFNHFTSEDSYGFQMDAEDLTQPEELIFQSSKSQDQILYNNEYYDPQDYQQEPADYYDQDTWSERPFDQFLDNDHPMPDAPPLARRRPAQRTGFNVGNPVQHRQAGPQSNQPGPNSTARRPPEDFNPHRPRDPPPPLQDYHNKVSLTKRIFPGPTMVTGQHHQQKSLLFKGEMPLRLRIY